MVDDAVGALVAVVPHRLVHLRQIGPGHDGGFGHVQNACGDEFVHARHLEGIAQVRAQDAGAGHEDAPLACPHLRRIKRQPAAGQVFAVDDAASEGLDQRRAHAQGVVAGTVEHHIRRAARVARAAQQRADGRAKGLERAVLKVAHGGAKGADVLPRVGQRRQAGRPVEARAQAALQVFERDHAGQRALKAQRLHKLALRVGGGGHHATGAQGAHGLDHLQPRLVQQRRAAHTVVQQHGVGGPCLGAFEHDLRRGTAGLADEAEVVARRRTVEGQLATLGQQLERPAKRRLPGVRDDLIGQPAAVAGAVRGQQRFARRQPVGQATGGHGCVQARQPRRRAVQRAHGALAGDEGRARRAGDTARHRQAQACGGLQRFQPGAGGRALDKQRLPRRHAQCSQQRAHDGAQVEHVAAGLFQRQVARHGVQLRRLRDEKLRMAAAAGFVALDGKAGVHGVAPGQRAEQLALARVHRHQVAHFEPTLAPHLAAQRGHQGHAARAGDLHVVVMVVEGRNGHTRERPQVVEVDLGGQHVDQRLVRLGQVHGHDEFVFGLQRRAEGGLAGGRIARHAKRKLPRRQRRDAGEKRRAARQQALRGEHRVQPLRAVAHAVHAAPAHRQRRAGLVQKLADAGLAALRVDHGLRKQLGLGAQAGVQAFGPARAHRLQQPLARRAAAGPGQLCQHALQVLVGQGRIQRQRRGRVPVHQTGLAFGQRRAQHAGRPAAGGTGRAQVVADARVRQRQRVAGLVGQLVHQPHRPGLGGRHRAPTQQQVQRVTQTGLAAARGQQARQALRAAVAGQQAQADLGLAQPRRELGHAVVAGQRKFQPTAQRHALDGGDTGLAHALDLAECQVRVVGQGARFVQGVHVFQQLAHVGTRHEAARALAGEDDGGHLVAARQVFHQHRQLVQRTFVQRIHRRVVDGDGGHAPAQHGVGLHREVAVALEQLLLVGQALALLPVVDDAAQLGNRFGVLQRRQVAHLAAFDQRAHHAAHVLAAARFGELADLDEVARHGHRALLGAHQFTQAAAVVVCERTAGRGLDEGQRREAPFAVRRADDDDVAHGAVRVQRLVAQDGAFDFFGAQAVAADVDDVVAAPVQAVATVGVAHREVALRVGPSAAPAGPVGAGPARAVAAPAGLHAAALHLQAGGVAPHGARQVGVGRGDDDLALLAVVSAAPGQAAGCGVTPVGRVGVCMGGRIRLRMGGRAGVRIGRRIRRRSGVFAPHVAQDPGQRVGVGVSTQRKVGVAIEVRPDHAAMLGGPVAVDVVRRHQVHAELLHRGARGFGAEGGHAQAAQVVLLHVAHVLRVGHHRLQEGDAGLEDAHTVALDDGSKAPGVREGGRALGHHAGTAGSHGGAQQVALAGDPARVGHDINHVARRGVEGHLHGVGHARGVAAVHVHHALGLAGGARGVDEEQRELRVQRQRRAAGPHGAHEVGVRQGQQRGLVGDGKTGLARGGHHHAGGGVGQGVAPHVALGPPHQIGLGGVAHHDHRVHARRRGHQGLGDSGAYARGLRGVEPAAAAQFVQRTAHAAHGVAALYRHFAR